MCTVCGCGGPDDALGGRTHDHGHRHDHQHDHGHQPGHDHQHDHGHQHHHGHEHQHSPDQVHHFGRGAAGVAVAGFTQDRLIRIEQDILSKNDGYADANRRMLGATGTFALNLMSGPGAGKTTLLVETLKALDDGLPVAVPVAVIEGDQQTENDAERIRATGARAVQINTGKGCHLDAHMVGHALSDIDPGPGGVIFIENIGNLVCPAAFDLGEAAKVIILSTTEGDDKPIKYPDMFAAADLLLISKVDLLEHVDFDPERAVEFARRVNPGLEVLRVSAKSGEGMTGWLDWIAARVGTTALAQRAEA